MRRRGRRLPGDHSQVVASPGSGVGAILANGMREASDGHGEQTMHGEMADVAAVGITIEPEGGREQPTTEPIAALPLSA